MHARVVLGVGKGVLFREVSSVQACPHRERGSTVNVCIYILTNAPASMISSSTGVEQLIEKRSCVFLDLPPFLVSFFYTHTHILHTHHSYTYKSRSHSIS